MLSRQLRALGILTIAILLISSTLSSLVDKTVHSFNFMIEDEVNDDKNYKQPMKDGITPKITDVPAEAVPVKTNVLRYGSFEQAGSNGVPTGWNGYTSIYSKRNFTYQDEVYQGSFSGLLEAKGTITNGGDEYAYRYLGSDQPKLTEKLSFSIWFNVSANDDLEKGGTTYFQIRVYNGTNYYLYYYLSYSTISAPTPGWNSTNHCYFNLNHSLSEWHNIVRNISSDYEAAFGGTLADHYVSRLYIYVYSPSNATGLTQMLIDNVSLENDTGYEYLENGDFENGVSSPWNTNRVRSPGYASLTDSEATDGNYAANLSCHALTQDSSGYCDMSYWFNYPQGYYPAEPSSLVIEFDWMYNATDGGNNEYAYVYFYLTNETYYSYFYYYLGRKNNVNPQTNYTAATYSNFYFNATGFGSRGTWQHQEIDFYDTLSTYNINNLTLNGFDIYINLGYDKNSSIQLLIDNFKVITYPTGDPGFEQDWFGSTSYPLTGWLNEGNGYPYTNKTSDSHSGNLAANITAYNSYAGGVRRNTYVEMDNYFFTGFWWRLDTLTTGSSAYAYYRLSFEGGYELYYYIAFSTGVQGIPSNDSYQVRYAVEHFNETGTWYSIYRNITNDLNASFGQHKWNLTYVYFNAYGSGGEKISVVIDDVYIVLESSYKPTISSVNFDPYPTYYEMTKVECEAFDRYSGINEVRFFYQTDSTWYYEVATFTTGTTYESFLPVFAYDTSVRFYVNATTKWGISGIDDNFGLYYSYGVGDDINPMVTITAPANGTTWADDVQITVTANDIGSSIAYVEIYSGINLLWNDTSAPYEFTWNTRSANNGTQSIIAVAYDNAGNSATNTTEINVQNDVAPPIISFAYLIPTAPEHMEQCTVICAASDISSIHNVSLYYQIGTESWQVVSMNVDGSLYSTSIPAASWNTEVLYYIKAFDTYGQYSSHGNLSVPLSYIVSDSVLPILNVNGPTSDTVLGTVDFSITASDAASGVDKLEVFIDTESVYTSTSFPSTFSWDTTSLSNGEYTLIFRLTDNAGNSVETLLSYTVNNPKGLEAMASSIGSFMQDYGFIAGMASLVGLYAIFKIFLWRRRRGSG